MVIRLKNRRFFNREICADAQTRIFAAAWRIRMGKYHIAIYLRLSKEDDKLKKESNSIAMQRLLLQSYVAENFEECELSEFCDDGYTGTNFVEVR